MNSFTGSAIVVVAAAISAALVDQFLPPGTFLPGFVGGVIAVAVLTTMRKKTS